MALDSMVTWDNGRWNDVYGGGIMPIVGFICEWDD